VFSMIISIVIPIIKLLWRMVKWIFRFLRPLLNPWLGKRVYV
jgi:hypothetical protein